MRHMLVKFEDKEYAFDIEALTVGDARTIKQQTGLTVKKLMNGLEELDVDALCALYWLMRKQNGIQGDTRKDDFHILKFAEALADAFAAEVQTEEEEVPTEAETPPTT